MKPLWVFGVTGLYQELFQPDTLAVVTPVKAIENETLDSGKIFWNELLQPERITKVVNTLKENIHNPKHHLPQFLGIVGDKKKFIDNILDGRTRLCDQGRGPKHFFCKLEVLAILCELYSRFEYYPFQLNIQNGFQLKEVSAREIVYNSQSISHNPYLPFIYDHILPLVLENAPDVIFCTGKISYFHIALAQIVKRILPDVHISVTRHSSEYYSLNKIERYLKRNVVLFSVIDSIVLEHFHETEQSLLNTLGNNQKLYQIPNLLTFNKKDNDHRFKRLSRNVTFSSASSVIGRRKQISGLSISPENVYDIHFEPYVKCFWNKCVFCGINKKYTYEDLNEEKAQTEGRLESMCSRLPNKAYLWFIDEAIHPLKLRQIAEYFIANSFNYTWQARCRINSDLLARGLPEKLAKSGLKELRLGLESASVRVLNLMEKFEEDFRLKLVEQIVGSYSSHGISIHFPVIIGFPSEEVADRQATYEFLASMRKKYPTLTFNINIFNLDVSSPLFRQWDKYAVSKITFPCTPQDFIGNIIDWDDHSKPDILTLERERNTFMRNKLYPWMPPNSLIIPTIFYRLSETIRNTLTWKCPIFDSQKIPFSLDQFISRSPDLVIYKKSNGEYLVYNWGSHHYLEGDKTMIKLLNTWATPKSVEQGIEDFGKDEAVIPLKDDIAILIRKLLAHGHLESAIN